MSRVLTAPVILFLFFLHILDLTIAPSLPFSSARILFVYLFIIYAAFQWEDKNSAPLALAAGVLRDATSAEFLGFELLSLTACALMLDWSVHKLDRHSVFVRSVVTFLFVLTAQFLCLALTSILSPESRFVFPVLAIVFKTALWNSLVAVLFFPLVAVVFRDNRPLRQYELFR